MNGSEEWKDYLHKEEEILWQGKPDAGLYIHPSRILSFTMGLFFLGISFVIVLPATLFAPHSDDTPRIFAVLFSVVFTSFSGFFVLAQTFWPAFRRRHSFYTLTSQRAIIGIDLPYRTRRLKFYEIAPNADYEYVPGPLGSIIFDYEDEGVRVNKRPQMFAAGFMRFKEAGHVWNLLQELQSKMSGKSDLPDGSPKRDL